MADVIDVCANATERAGAALPTIWRVLCPCLSFLPAMSIAVFVALASPSQKASARRLSAPAWVSTQAIATMKVSGRIHVIAQTARPITRVSVVGSQ